MTHLQISPKEETRRREQSRLAVSRHEAAHQLGCSVQHIDDLAAFGRLKKIQLGNRRVAITWASLVQLVYDGGDLKGCRLGERAASKGGDGRNFLARGCWSDFAPRRHHENVMLPPSPASTPQASPGG